jgi:hypothetical protein
MTWEQALVCSRNLLSSIRSYACLFGVNRVGMQRPECRLDAVVLCAPVEVVFEVSVFVGEDPAFKTGLADDTRTGEGAAGLRWLTGEQAVNGGLNGLAFGCVSGHLRVPAVRGR